MAYRFGGTDPFLRCSAGAFNGFSIDNSASSCFGLLKRATTGAWMGVWSADTGGSLVYHDMLEFNPSNFLTSWVGDSGIPATTSSTALTDTANWMIVGYTWDGTNGAAAMTFSWKIGAGAWTSQSVAGSPGTTHATWGAAYRHVVGNEPGLGDDANFDITCVGAIKSQLSSGTFQTLDMASIDSWDSVFTGATAWLLGFDDISTRTDRAGNGGNETSRSAGVTLQSDPPGWSWGAPTSLETIYVAGRPAGPGGPF